MTETPLHYKTITEVAGLIESRELSPVDVTGAMLERIDALDGHLKSYATVMADHALQSARRAEREIEAGEYRGPLHGIPIAVKDLCFTRGVRTMGGAKVYADHVPEFDSTVVERLEAAGAVLLGKLNLTEGAMGGYNPEFQIPLNPWDNAGGPARPPAALEWRPPPGCASDHWAATLAARYDFRRPHAESSD